jgi:hypothetical protein
MTRKYRGKRIDNGEWVYYPDRSGIVEFKTDATLSITGTEYQVDPATVGQSTGLKDRGDTEAYFGQTVHTYYDDGWRHWRACMGRWHNKS